MVRAGSKAFRFSLCRSGAQPLIGLRDGAAIAREWRTLNFPDEADDYDVDQGTSGASKRRRTNMKCEPESSPRTAPAQPSASAAALSPEQQALAQDAIDERRRGECLLYKGVSVGKANSGALSSAEKPMTRPRILCPPNKRPEVRLNIRSSGRPRYPSAARPFIATYAYKDPVTEKQKTKCAVVPSRQPEPPSACRFITHSGDGAPERSFVTLLTRSLRTHATAEEAAKAWCVS